MKIHWAVCLVLILVPMYSGATCVDIDCTCKKWGITDPFCKITCESVKATCLTAEKGVKELGNALEDVRILVETGTCGGDICDVFEATKNFAVDQVKDTSESLRRAGERLREGKPLDAIWHLQMDYLNNSQENAADAARRSSVLQATGAIAAGAYGGPGGSAGYAAWLTYNETKNLGLALKTGIITGAAAYASTAVNVGPQNRVVMPGNAASKVAASQVAVRAVMGGVIAGVAVAAAGGKQEEIENAISRGAVAVLVREGYRELTSHELNRQNLKSSTGDAYCLKADPATNPALACLPPPKAYIRDEIGNIKYECGTKCEEGVKVPLVNMKMLDEFRPHVGTWAEAFKSIDDKTSEGQRPFLGTSESSGFMTFVSRLPGWNAMGVAHDEYDVLTNPGTKTAIDIFYQVGTIAPFVVLTYEGTGGGVHDMIRTVASSRTNSSIQSNGGGAVSLAPRFSTRATAVAAANRNRQALPTEITHVVCRRAKAEKNFLMRVALSEDGGVDDYGRVCRIDQGTKDLVIPIWHAHFERYSCISQLKKLVKAQLKQRYRCASSIGLRQSDIKLTGNK